MLAACERGGPDTGGVRIVVSIAPVMSIVASLAPPGAELATLIPAGGSLHGYEVTPADVAKLGTADVVVYVGLGLDPKVSDFLAAHPSEHRAAVCFADVVGLRLPEGFTGEHGESDHGGDELPIDQHLWLDPALVARLVPAVRRAIEETEARRGPVPDAERARLEAAERELLVRINAVDREYAERLRPLAGKAIVTHHDAFRRIADRYGLRIAAVIRPIESAEPTPGAIADAAEAAKAEGAKAVFFEPQFDPASARRIAAAAGARLGRLDPEGETDWFALMRGNLDSLVAGLGSDTGNGDGPGG
jgi:ABC-type Zn uptake system ZnuABC Zn-binding protein ZnuA